MNYDVFFVAYWKNGEPTQLVDGPFFTPEDAHARIDASQSTVLCVVKTTLEFEEVKP